MNTMPPRRVGKLHLPTPIGPSSRYAWARFALPTLRKCVLLLGLLMVAGAAQADTVYLKQEDFIQQTFGAAAPAPQFLWLDAAAQAKLQAIFNHPYPQARIRYWRAGGKTAWILDETGKEFPITAGFIVKDHAIDSARLLVYRESRGDEIHYPAFLKQFAGVHLQDDHLAPGVDGISGATLSVSAMQRMAHAALVLDALAP
jgi:hypothetical protein